MKLAFFAHHSASNYWCVGGTESLVRRLAQGLVNEGHESHLVLYGWQGPPPRQPAYPKIQLHYVQEFGEALNLLEALEVENVITVYVHRRERIAYARFRRALQHKMRFHVLHLGWHPRFWGRILRRLETQVAPYNGYVLAVSPRLCQAARRSTSRVVQLLPPVPTEYFRRPEEKARNGSIRVAFIGRLDPAKGFHEARALLRYFQQRNGAAATVYGVYSDEMPASLALHEELQKQSEITYVPARREDYSEEMEEKIRSALAETDILVLPYRSLSSSVDMPLLVLEGMASLCAVVAPAVHHIPAIYGESPFLVKGGLEKWKRDFPNPSRLLDVERKRLRHRNREIDFCASSVVRRLAPVLARG